MENFKVYTIDGDGKKNVISYAATRHAAKKYIVGRWGHWPSFVGITTVNPSIGKGFVSW